MIDKQVQQVLSDLKRVVEQQREQIAAYRFRLDGVDRRVAALVRRESDRVIEWSALLDALPTDSPAASLIHEHLNGLRHE